MEDQEVRYKITPKFNFLYEMGMPTGSKIRNTMLIFILFIIATIIVLAKGGNIVDTSEINLINSLPIDKFLIIVCFIADVIIMIKLIINIVFQSMQYNHISYTFYDRVMVYEDDFLNQHRKTIEYKNIKEVEIRRTIWDRLLNYGVMIVYTNADNDRNNGLVIYSIRDPKSHYDIINGLIHKKDYSNETLSLNNNVEGNLQANEDINKDISSIQKPKDEPEEDFKESLKNINKE